MTLCVRNARTLENQVLPEFIWPVANSTVDTILDEEGVVCLPALIDPHVHGRVPGMEHKEDWEHLAQAAIHGGITTLFDMPNTKPATTHLEAVQEKKRLIERQLQAIDIPLHYGLFLGVSEEDLSEIARCKNEIIGVKLYMGPSTGALGWQDQTTLTHLFEMCAKHDLLLVIHAEDRERIETRKNLFLWQDPLEHSVLRDPFVAAKAIKQIVQCVQNTGARAYIAHVSSQAEIEELAKAKDLGLPIYAEASPVHLFLDTQDYATLGTRALVNPPIRERRDRAALWQALGTVIDTIGSDHAPHLLSEKDQPYGKAPSGIPGVETTLPMLLTAVKEGRLSGQLMQKLTVENIQRIFRYPSTQDKVLVDMRQQKTLKERGIRSKCAWSPFADIPLYGWPIYTYLQAKSYRLGD